MDLTATAIRLIVCPRCEARPRVGCVTLAGTRATRPHAARTAAVYAAWRDGYGDGLGDVLDTAERTLAAGHALADLIRDLRLRIELRPR